MYTKGDVVYGYAYFHKIYDYCVVEKYQFNPTHGTVVFGTSPTKRWFYMMKISDIIPKEVIESPLFKIMRELDEL